MQADSALSRHAARVLGRNAAAGAAIEKECGREQGGQIRKTCPHHGRYNAAKGLKNPSMRKGLKSPDFGQKEGPPGEGQPFHCRPRSRVDRFEKRRDA